MQRPALIRIFLVFLRLGLTAFGGPAMVPFIRARTVEREGWLDEPTFSLGMSLTQLLPGATAMQVAAYVGLRARGGAGALAAYVGFGLPALLLMLGLTVLYFSARDVAAVTAAFTGLQLVITALILDAAVNFARRYLDSLADKLLACLAGVWLGLRGNPILAMAVVCVLAVFLVRDGQCGLPEPREGTGRGPLRFAGLLLASLLALLAVLWLVAPELFRLGLLMVKIDCFAFGGGYVSVPLMLHEVVEVRGWLTEPMFMDGIALGQVTPGPIVMTGAFVGYAVSGLAGALVAAVTVFSPSLIVLCAATPFADRLVRSPVARRVLKGSLISLVGLMAAVAVRFALSIHWTPGQALLALAAFAALRLKVDILWVVLAGAGLGAVLF
ncbi:chromate transporter, chromate ion transporter (CHR) family [Pseudodesulfovibrio mercurii]|uniref:Chromate transporter, chromate ion transporter (CHR) family n=1 Tax=Pseudodesulfovibrio mercurii TaxID=641491 RepID=F0JGY5_9BACT|nr:chromate efflux transporter [Pseudodesulfovibrio mercurii]EGB15175.1 chromate transporter, chromate ion transporter (CHR) family [Pseudodesulfovibrio mercurii]